MESHHGEIVCRSRDKFADHPLIVSRASCGSSCPVARRKGRDADAGYRRAIINVDDLTGSTIVAQRGNRREPQNANLRGTVDLGEKIVKLP